MAILVIDFTLVLHNTVLVAEHRGFSILYSKIFLLGAPCLIRKTNRPMSG